MVKIFVNFVCFLFIYGAIFWFVQKLAARRGEKLASLLYLPVDQKILSIFRISLGCVSLCMALQNYSLCVFTEIGLSLPSYILPLLNTAWVVSSVLTVLGMGGRCPYILSSLLIPVLLHADVGKDNLFMCNVWAIFMKLDVWWVLFPTKSIVDPRSSVAASLRSPTTNAFWPVFCLLLNSGFYLFASGVSKLLDPVWMSGLGLYYTYLNDWLRHGPIFDCFLENHVLMILANYATPIIEITTFPLLIYKRTRLLGSLLFVFFFLTLTFIFRIDAIGPSGIVIGVALISISLNGRKHSPSNPSVGWKPEKKSLLRIAVVAYLFTCITMVVMREAVRGGFSYPKVGYPFTLEGRQPLSFFERVGNVAFQNPLPSRYHIVNGWYAPFGFNHFFGRFAYKIEVVAQGGRTHIPNPIFSESGHTNFKGPGGGVLKPRVLQDRLTFFGFLAGKHSLTKNIQFNRTDIEFFDRLARFSSHKASPPKKMIIHVREYEMPGSYRGVDRSRYGNQWVPLLSYSVERRSIELLEPPPAPKFNHINISLFQQGHIKYDP